MEAHFLKELDRRGEEGSGDWAKNCPHPLTPHHPSVLQTMAILTPSPMLIKTPKSKLHPHSTLWFSAIYVMICLISVSLAGTKRLKAWNVVWSLCHSLLRPQCLG